MKVVHKILSGNYVCDAVDVGYVSLVPTTQGALTSFEFTEKCLLLSVQTNNASVISTYSYFLRKFSTIFYNNIDQFVKITS